MQLAGIAAIIIGIVKLFDNYLKMKDSNDIYQIEGYAMGMFYSAVAIVLGMVILISCL